MNEASGDAGSREFVIRTDLLTKRFDGTTAIDSLTVDMPRGGVFGLLGPNGSGKTTLLGMLLGLMRPTGGSIEIFGTPFNGSDRATLRRIGATVETPAFYPYLSGRENLRFFQGISRRGTPADVDRLLEDVELLERADSKFHTYSLGMKQRLGIAYALLGEPELVFLDEPTNGLDPAGMVQVRELIQGLGGGGRTVVLSSHLLHEVEQVCDNVAIIVRGKLVAQGKVGDLLSDRGAISLDSSDNAKAQQILSGLGFVHSVRSEDGHIVVETDASHAADLTRALATRDVFVTAMAPVQLSLERYFLSVTDEEDAGSETSVPFGDSC